MKEKIKTASIVILCILCTVLVCTTTCSRRDNAILENNIAALNDTVHEYKLKNGELMYEKQGFILEKQELEKYLDISKKEVKELEKKLGSALATISKLQAQINIDTLQMHDTVTVEPDSTYTNNFYYSDDWLKLNGTSKFTLNPFDVSTKINNISIEANLKVGMSKDNKFFATSDNPYLKFTQIEGANMVAPQQKRWSVSLQLGVGGFVGLGACFPLPSGTVNTGLVTGVGLYGGIGCSYRLFDF